MAKRAEARSLSVAALGPIHKQDLRQRVIARIVELIRTGNLRPGDRLPPERELVEIFAISRPSLREAMRALSTLGIVESRHGGGTFVTDLDARTLLAPLNFFLQLSGQHRRHLREPPHRRNRDRAQGGHHGPPRRRGRLEGNGRRPCDDPEGSGRLPHPRQPLP
jgi:DNA-binding transcriptional regulator YhcF (GntR family)